MQKVPLINVKRLLNDIPPKNEPMFNVIHIFFSDSYKRDSTDSEPTWNMATYFKGKELKKLLLRSDTTVQYTSFLQ